MKNNFPLIILIVFIVAAVVGVLVFSGAIPIGGGGEENLGTVELWGTVPSQIMQKPLEEFNNQNPNLFVKYREQSLETFDQELLEALASGRGPDLFFLPDELVYHFTDKIITIPYTSYPAASFRNTFSSAGEVFLTSEGVLALPISIDPLMLYYNRSLLEAEGIIFPPKDWEEFSLDVAKLTKKNEAGSITRSGAALGQYANVTHAKKILAMLFMQSGNPIVSEQLGNLMSTLNSPVGIYNLPSTLEFYTSFADPAHPLYSWNRAFASAQDAFSSEDLAFYFGLASEVETLVNRNPNQNFFMAPVPQIKDAKNKLTAARVEGIAVSSSSKNPNAALAAANLLASASFGEAYASARGIAPARRDILAAPPPDSFSPIFYSSALFARSWLDPSPSDTEAIWSAMVNSILSNSLSPQEAVQQASSQLDLLLIR